jgi:hypothetical protein
MHCLFPQVFKMQALALDLPDYRVEQAMKYETVMHKLEYTYEQPMALQDIKNFQTEPTVSEVIELIALLCRDVHNVRLGRAGSVTLFPTDATDATGDKVVKGNRIRKLCEHFRQFPDYAAVLRGELETVGLVASTTRAPMQEAPTEIPKTHDPVFLGDMDA